MDPDAEIAVDLSPLIRIYKSGRVKRLVDEPHVPPSVDPATGVASKDATVDPDAGVSARLYLPKTTGSNEKKLPVLVYYHGGGFCIRTAFEAAYHAYLNSLVWKAEILAVSVEYRLAPEHPLPAAYRDSWAALKWVFSSNADPWLTEHGDLNRVFIAGESAGANIAHRMAMRVGEQQEGEVEGIVLVHPYFWGTEPIGSETRDPKRREWWEVLWRVVCPMGVDTDDPWVNPIGEAAPSLAGLGCRRAMVCVAGEDTLEERGRAYYEALRRSGWGGEAEIVVSDGEDHAFHLKKPECDKAKELMEKVVRFLATTHHLKLLPPDHLLVKRD